MAWLEAHQELRDHPKTKRAARMLGISRPQMIGHLLCLWWWCMDYAEDGDLSDFDNADIADAADWEGDPDTFIDALVKCGPADRSGFLVCCDGTVTVNDWQDYGGKYVTKRAQGRERQRNYRERNAAVTRDKSVSNTAREEERTEEKITKEEDAAADFATVQDRMIGQWRAVLGDTLTPAILPEVQQYMQKLHARGITDWWGMALTETTQAKRPGWQYLKAILEAWLAAGQPNYRNGNGSDPERRSAGVVIPPAKQAEIDKRQAAYEQQIALELAQAHKAGRL